jgi:predicted acylesterase/phospholipase RssA
MERDPTAAAGLEEPGSQRRLLLQLASFDLFANVPLHLLSDCLPHATVVSLRRGEILVRETDTTDCMYMIINGSLEVLLERGRPQPELVDVLGSGVCVGDLALLLGEPRTATVRALRDSEVIRLSGEGFRRLLERSPEVAIHLARTLGQRLNWTTHRPHRVRPIRTIGMVGASAGGADPGICESIFRAFEAEAHDVALLGRRQLETDLGVSADRLGSAADVTSRCQDWFTAQEEHHRYVLYRCDSEMTEWTKWCLRQADLVLVIARADDVPSADRIDGIRRVTAAEEPHARIEIVLLHESASSRFHGSHHWVHAVPLAAWHHVRVNREDDYRRLSRRVCGNALGVVLSGGGARGFAHIGVLQAIRESGLEIDLIGGTSMGAIIGAQYAAGYDTRAMIEMNRAGFSRRRRFAELAIPFVAIRNGRGTNRMLKRMFGDARIEDLPIPYFCVSCDLSRAEPVVHETGRLWLSTRASCSIPGLLPPVRHRGGLLVDGGLLDNLPVQAMRARCRGRVIAADVSVAVDFQPRTGAGNARRHRRWRLLRAFYPPRGKPNIGQILTRTVTVGSVRDSRAAGVPADLYIHPPVDQFSMTAFQDIDRLVELGFQHARREIAAWVQSGSRPSAAGNERE